MQSVQSPAKPLPAQTPQLVAAEYNTFESGVSSRLVKAPQAEQGPLVRRLADKDAGLQVAALVELAGNLAQLGRPALARLILISSHRPFGP